MLDAFATALAEVFALTDAEGLDAALTCAVAAGLAVVMVPGLTVATALAVLIVPAVGVGVDSVTVTARVGLAVAFALVALGLGTTVALGEAVVAPPEHADSASSSVAPSATGL